MAERKPKPEPAGLPLATVAEVRAILGEANALREAGVNLHHHEILERLAEVSGYDLNYYVFTFTRDDAKLSAAELDHMAAHLPRYPRPSGGP